MATESSSNASVSTQTLTGCVKWFNNGLNYGFITVLTEGVHRNTDVFVHQSNIRTARDCFRTLYTGECVQFELAKSNNDKHPVHAVNVHGFNGVQLRCEVPNRGFGGRGGRGGRSGRSGRGGRSREYSGASGRGGFRHGPSQSAVVDSATPAEPTTNDTSITAPTESATVAHQPSVGEDVSERVVATEVVSGESISVPVAKGSWTGRSRSRGRGRKVSA